MKDYYKILGLEETASAEEIHDRWIELMQKYHPDHGSGRATDEEIAKEVNEAYQVLKYSSSRMEYDLERVQQKSLRKFSFRKLILPVSGLTFLLILSLIYFRKPQVPAPLNRRPQILSPKLITPHDEPSPQVSSPQHPPRAEISVKVEREEKIASQRIGQEKKVVPSAPVSPKPITPHDEPGPQVSSPQHPPRAEISMKVEREEKIASPRKGQEKKVVPSVPAKKVEPSSPVVPSEISANLPLHSPSRELDRSQPIENQKPIELSEASKKIPAVHSVSDANSSAKKDDQVAKPTPSLLVTTEDEVRKFFNNYIERYNKKEAQAFLSLFSPKAVQNQKEGSEGIRRIYENFFQQSEELRYQIEGAKVEISQNAVEVKARFEVDQILRKGRERKVWKGHIQWLLVKEDGVLKIISLNYQHESTP